MKKVLKLMVTSLLALGLMGCAQQTQKQAPKPQITPEYVEQTTKWCQSVVDQKTAILAQVQLNPGTCVDFLNAMKKAGQIAPMVAEAGYTDLADALYNIASAQSELQLYIETQKNPRESAKHFTRAKQLLDAAEQCLR